MSAIDLLESLRAFTMSLRSALITISSLKEMLMSGCSVSQDVRAEATRTAPVINEQVTNVLEVFLYIRLY